MTHLTDYQALTACDCPPRLAQVLAERAKVGDAIAIGRIAFARAENAKLFLIRAWETQKADAA